MTTIARILGRVVDLTTVLGALAVFLMMAHITADVAGKFLFNEPLPGTLVFVSRYYMVIVAFLSLAFAERRDAHISVEVVAERLAMGVQHRLGFFTTLLSAVIFGLLAWRGLEEAQSKQAIGAFILEQDIAIPVWPSFYLLPLGAGLMSLVLAFKLVRHLYGGADAPVGTRF